nr:hypothetical protein GCM10020093_002120 [Planobispora longispora]
MPGLRMVVVAGPRVDPSRLPSRPGLEVRSWVPDLHRHLAACDLAVVQGGLTTCMELTAAARPFVYVPLRNHFEQQFHVAHRLRRHGPAGGWTTPTWTPACWPRPSPPRSAARSSTVPSRGRGRARRRAPGRAAVRTHGLL